MSYENYNLPKFRGAILPWEQDRQLSPVEIAGREIPVDMFEYVFVPDNGKIRTIRQGFKPDKKSDKVLKDIAHEANAIHSGWHLTHDSPVLSYEDTVRLLDHCRDNDCSYAEAMIALFADHSSATGRSKKAWKEAPRLYHPDIADKLNDEHGLGIDYDAELAKEQARHRALTQAKELEELRKENNRLERQAKSNKSKNTGSRLAAALDSED